MNWKAAKLIAIDTETTGTDPEEALIVEVGAFYCEGGDLDAGIRFGQLVNPGSAIPKEATEIHGITDEAVAELDPIESMAPRLLARIAAADAIVGYNWPYDRRCLERAIGDTFTAAIAGKPILDALEVVRLKDVGRFWKGAGRHKLGSVAERMKIARRGNAHRASSDAELATRILYRFANRLPEELGPASAFLAFEAEKERERFEAWKAANPLPDEATA